jgi:hypothetical protein
MELSKRQRIKRHESFENDFSARHSRTHGKKRDEAGQHPRQIIEAVGQVVLQPDADDVQIFFTRAENLTAQNQIANENAN